MSRKAGCRVFAIQRATDTTVYVYGFGTHLGDFPRPDWTVTAADRRLYESTIRRHDAQRARERDMARPMSERVDDLAYHLSLNPKIALDNGGVVWGYECWWGEMDDDATEPPAQFIGDRTVVYVPAPHPPEVPPAGPCAIDPRPRPGQLHDDDARDGPQSR